ncbi:MAG: ABC transporter permease [Armatimonadota bacterium]
MSWMLPDRFPVFWEEVRRRSSKQHMLLSVLLFICLFSFIVPLQFAIQNGNRAVFWHGLMVVQGYLVVALAPMLALSTFTSQRQRGSLDFLFLLPISMRSLVLQKLGSTGLPILLVLLCFLPISAISGILGHISAGEFGAVYLLQLSRGVCYTALGLAVSSLSRYTRTAAIVTYFIIMLVEYHGRQLLVDRLLPFIGRYFPQYNFALLPMTTQYLLAALLFLMLAGVALWACIAALERQRASRSRGLQAGHAQAGLVVPHRHLPDRHAMLYYDLRHRLRSGRGYSVILGFVLMLCVMLVAFTYLDGPGGDPTGWPEVGRDLFRYTMIGQLVMAAVISPGLTATLFSNEREAGRFDFLLLTRLTSRELVVERFWAAMLPLLLAVLGGAPVVAIIATTYGGVSPLEFSVGYLLVTLCGLLCAATALMCSCDAESSSAALIHGYLGAIGLTVVAAALTIVFCIGIPLTIYFIYFSLNQAAYQLQNRRRPYSTNPWIARRYW